MTEGAAALAGASDAPPAELARRVASPGGTTEAGLSVLDAGDGLGPLILRTLDASRRRGIEMAEAARQWRIQWSWCEMAASRASVEGSRRVCR